MAAFKLASYCLSNCIQPRNVTAFNLSFSMFKIKTMYSPIYMSPVGHLLYSPSLKCAAYQCPAQRQSEAELDFLCWGASRTFLAGR